MLVPKIRNLTDLIIFHERKLIFHAEHKQVLPTLQQKYWIISGIKQLKKIIYHRLIPVNGFTSILLCNCF